MKKIYGALAFTLASIATSVFAANEYTGSAYNVPSAEVPSNPCAPVWNNPATLYASNNINPVNHSMPTVFPPPGNYCNFFEAVLKGKPLFYFRLRNEDVNENDKKTAYANTILTHLGYQTASFYHLYGLLEFTNTTIIGNQIYNSGGGTSPNLIRYAMINDPKGTRIDQAFLGFDGFYKTDIKLGRQRITLDNERFIGNVAWRQMEQTFDGVSIYNTNAIPNLSTFYSYISQVNRVWGPNGVGPFSNNTNYTNLVNVRYDITPLSANVVAYGYFIHNADVPTYSTKTGGLRFNGVTPVNIEKKVNLLYTLEYAHQNGAYNHPKDYSAYYTRISGGVGFSTCVGDIELDLQREDLSGNRNKLFSSFVTPYATFHPFQGWAEIFVITPRQGVIDSYASASIKLTSFYDIGLQAFYHNFRASAVSKAFGNEIDFGISKDFNKYITGSIDYANFSHQTAQFPHRQRIWVTLRSGRYV